jgi:essential nuclear protein 1
MPPCHPNDTIDQPTNQPTEHNHHPTTSTQASKQKCNAHSQIDTTSEFQRGKAGEMPKAKVESTKAGRKHNPLGEQIAQDETRHIVSRDKAADKRKWAAKAKELAGDEDDDEPEQTFLPKNLSRKILNVAREQMRDEARSKATVDTAMTHADDDDDEEEVEEVEVDEDEATYAGRDHFAELSVSDQDQDALARFMSSEPTKRRTLADIIMEKLHEKQKSDADAAATSEAQEAKEAAEQELSPQVLAVYTDVGKLLRRYRAGKLPKAFKIIPSLRNWEEVLYVTEPHAWSNQAMSAATRIFASNLNPKMAQRFYALVLMPRVRDDILDNKVLNYHLYMSVKKAMYKPAAFFKGILLPLCEGGDCTLREATIIGSVVAKVSIPMVHAAAAMLKIASMSYTGANSLFLRVLMDKKFSLPQRVLDALVAHFVKFTDDERVMPVLWHQSLLTFSQRYKNTLSPAQRNGIKRLLRVHHHHQITPEIRRELFGSAGVAAAAAAMN